MPQYVSALDLLLPLISLSKTAVVGADDVSLKVTEVSRQAAMERARLMDEIRDLKDELSQSALQPDVKANAEVCVLILGVVSTYFPLQDTHWRSMFEHEQAEVESLRMALDEQSAELDGLRKKLNREMPMNSLLEHSRSPSKHESDEIKGLKYDT